ncbi:HPP family protein [Altibacter sp.]|uniref:HPP family protein n=1 Tax=Altibacter sp. TaxID=2024823 RepID=UPI002585CD40|nr:HPP family protein [Altibacter sp.]MCW9038064.1 HPP family protein [Altibacter sp.]
MKHTKRKKISQNIKRNARISRYVIYRETSIDFKEQFWSFIGAFVGISIIAFLQSSYLPRLENILLIGTFGASSVLIFGAIQSPLTQPRNFIGGQIISGLIGVTVFKCLPEIIWITAPLAVATSIVVMQITKTLHPPGGATALIAVIGTEKIKALGYFYVISPVMSGTIILFITALVFNNMTKHRKYPTNSRLTRIFKRREDNE